MAAPFCISRRAVRPTTMSNRDGWIPCAGRLVVNLFDLAIFPAIWLEEIFLSKKRTSGNLQSVPDEPMTTQAMEDPDQTIEYEDSQD